MDRVKRMKDLELKNQRLRKAVSDLTLGKLILAEAAKSPAPDVLVPTMAAWPPARRRAAPSSTQHLADGRTVN